MTLINKRLPVGRNPPRAYSALKQKVAFQSLTPKERAGRGNGLTSSPLFRKAISSKSIRNC